MRVDERERDGGDAGAGEPGRDDPRIAAVESGDEEAFESLIAEYGDRVFSFGYRMCGHREDAEDVYQETFLTLFNKVEGYRGEGPLRNWLFKVASSHCLKRRRKRSGEPEHHLSVEELRPETLRPLAEGPTLGSLADQPLDRVLHAELSGRLQQAIERLPEEYRIVVLLRDVEGFDTAETARMLDLSEAAVKSRLHRGRLAIRKALQPYLEEVAG